MDTGFVRGSGSVQFEGLETGELQKDTERERERKGERHKTARKLRHSDNPS